MRNPWGKEKYKGPWSDEDKEKWTPEAKKALKHETAMDDGIFFMPIADFHKLFTETIIGFYADWKIARKEAVWDRRSAVRELKWTFTNPVA